MSAIVVISSHYESRRFPGKPLAKINGKEMILYCAKSAISAVGNENIIVATDSPEIESFVTSHGINTVKVETMRCSNCSDCTSEAIRNMDVDVIVDLQGDEPLVKPEDILKAIELKRSSNEHVINAFAYEKDGESTNTIKAVVKNNYASELIYMSRLPIPFASRIFTKQIGLYCFYKNQLNSIYGYDKPKGLMERLEDVHILRCLDNNIKVKMFRVDGKYQSVDVPDDIKKVEDILNDK